MMEFRFQVGAPVVIDDEAPHPTTISIDNLLWVRFYLGNFCAAFGESFVSGKLAVCRRNKWRPFSMNMSGRVRPVCKNDQPTGPQGHKAKTPAAGRTNVRQVHNREGSKE